MSAQDQQPHPFGGFMRRYVAMRQAQNAYFKGRTNSLLQEALDRERVLDEFADRFFKNFPDELPKPISQSKLL